MDFADVLRRRKAVRSYLPDPIPRETLERIVGRGRKIPSAGHSQGLRLVVATEEETRRAMAELALEPEYVATGLPPWISRAPAHVIVCVREEDYRARYREPDKTHGEDAEEFAWPVPYWWVDAGAAVMLIWLAALDEGLACGVYGMPGDGWEGLRGLLGIPADVQPVAVLTIGKQGPDTVHGLSEARLEASGRRRPLGTVVGGDAFVDRLATAEIGGTFNQYRASRLLRERLEAYLEDRRDAPLVLVGEAAGYRGARISGIPFTSERQLTGGGLAEATATIVHRVLAELYLEDSVLLWNVVPTHPGTASTNRRPTSREIDAALPFLRQLARGRRAVAVGRVAHAVLGGAYVRHPSHGGAQAFRAGLVESLR